LLIPPEKVMTSTMWMPDSAVIVPELALLMSPEKLVTAVAPWPVVPPT
jgi:hypothetical protein